MSTLLRPELERFLTRRVTWIGALTTGVAMILVGWAVSTPNPYQGSTRPLSMNDGINTLMVVAVFGSALAYFAAASYAGSEQSSGALGTWLTFTPRRAPVFAAKLVTVALPSLGFALMFALLLLGLQQFRNPGTYSTPAELVGLAVRVAITVASFAVLGLVVAVIGKSTLSALGALLGYLALMLLQVYAISFNPSRLGSWFGPERMLGQFLLAQAPPNARPPTSGDIIVHQSYFDYPAIALAGAGWLLVIALITLIGGRVFARRDVN